MWLLQYSINWVLKSVFPFQKATLGTGNYLKLVSKILIKSLQKRDWKLWGEKATTLAYLDARDDNIVLFFTLLDDWWRVAWFELIRIEFRQVSVWGPSLLRTRHVGQTLTPNLQSVSPVPTLVKHWLEQLNKSKQKSRAFPASRQNKKESKEGVFFNRKFGGIKEIPCNREKW